MPNQEQVLNALRTIIDPDLGQDIVSLGFVKQVNIDNGTVSLTIELTTPACPVKEMFRKQASDAVMALEGVNKVNVELTANVKSRNSATSLLPGVKQIIAIASGKGGVGKSTVTANLACALRATGANIGLLDADIYGPSIPKMMGNEAPQLSVNDSQQLIPCEQYGVKIMSLGFMVTDESPVIWRGPMVHNILNQFLRQVDWGELDYMLIDLPPGTGDAQLTITQALPLSGAIIVTTPQEVSIHIASKGLKMFEEVKVPVLGFVENMSGFVCPHCQKTSDIFRRGGTRKASEMYQVKFLGEIPLDEQIALDGDYGKPTVISHQDSLAAAAYREIAGQIAAELSTRQASNSAGVELKWSSGS